MSVAHLIQKRGELIQSYSIVLVRDRKNSNFALKKDIRSIIVSKDNPAYKDIRGALFTKDGKTLIRYPAGKGHPLKV